VINESLVVVDNKTEKGKKKPGAVDTPDIYNIQCMTCCDQLWDKIQNHIMQTVANSDIFMPRWHLGWLGHYLTASLL